MRSRSSAFVVVDVVRHFDLTAFREEEAEKGKKEVCILTTRGPETKGDKKENY